MEPTSKNWKQFLPSKHFMSVAGSIVLVGGLILGMRYVWLHRNTLRLTPQQKALHDSSQKISVGELIGRDTDSDGISDWEEALWGTDPQKVDTDGNGKTDKEEIDVRKAALDTSSSAATTDRESNETALLAQQLFATIVSLSQSGNLTSEAIENLSDSIGNSITIKTLDDTYTTTSIKTGANTKAVRQKLFTDFKKLVQTYDQYKFGSELELMEQQFEAGNIRALESVRRIAVAYQKFAVDAAKLTVPTDYSTQYVVLLNSYDKIGRTLIDLSVTDENPLVSISAFVQYSTHSAALVDSIEAFKAYMAVHGILK